MFKAQKTTLIEPSPALFVGVWELKIQHPTASQFAKRVSTPSGLRRCLGLSCRELAELLGDLSGVTRDRSTICKYEKGFTGRYERRHASSRYLRHAYKALIVSYVEWRSGGRLTARVAMTGPHARRWKVTPIKTKGVK